MGFECGASGHPIVLDLTGHLLYDVVVSALLEKRHADAKSRARTLKKASVINGTPL